MDETRIFPADPVEAAQAPGDGDDASETETATHPKRRDKDVERQLSEQRAYVENEGLVKPASRNAQEIDAGREQALEEKAQAAQRGRTA